MCFLQKNLYAQVYTNPVIPTLNDTITIFFQANLGSGGLENYDGDVYMHTGASSQKIPHDKPIAELFYHFSEVGEHNLILTEGKLNSEPVSDKFSGSIFIDEFIPGDVDDNKVVDAFDAAVILHRVVEKELIPNDSVLWWNSDIWFNWRYNAADVSQDDNLNAFDASLILQKIVGLIGDYPTSISENSGITLAIENGQILISTEDEINAITLTLNKSEYFSLTEPDYLVSNVTGVWNETDEKYMFSMAAPVGINENLLSFPYEINTNDSFILELKSETDNTIKEYSFEISNTGIVSEEYEKEQPIRYHLSQNYPNPFNPSTRIEYSLPETSIVRLEIYNSIGKKIKVVRAVGDALGLKNIKPQHVRAEQLNSQYDFVVSRAVAQMNTFVKWVDDKISPVNNHPTANGIFYLKGGDLTEELSIFPKAEITPLSTHFSEEFFKTKSVVYLPLN